jgi:hypothetical protein
MTGQKLNLAKFKLRVKQQSRNKKGKYLREVENNL